MTGILVLVPLSERRTVTETQAGKSSFDLFNELQYHIYLIVSVVGDHIFILNQ